MSRLVAALWMGLWIMLMAWGAWWVMQQGWWLMKIDWIWTGLAIIVIAGFVMAVSAHGILIVLRLLAGYTTPRLAKRDFRDSVANLLMFAKTGFWKE